MKRLSIVFALALFCSPPQSPPQLEDIPERPQPDSWRICVATWFNTDGRHGYRYPSLSLKLGNHKLVQDYTDPFGVGCSFIPLGSQVWVYSPRTGIMVECVVIDPIAEMGRQENYIDLPLTVWRWIFNKNPALGVDTVIVFWNGG